MLRPRTILLPLLLIAVQLHAGSVFIPVLQTEVSAPGPSNWSTLVWIHNASASRLDATGLMIDVPCPMEACWAPYVDAQTTRIVLGPWAPSGLVLHVPDAVAGQVFVSARFSAVRRDLGYMGTELPIAREADFRSEPMVFAGVPLIGPYGRRVRTHLRLYSLDTGAVEVMLRVRAPWSNPTFETVVVLSPQNAPAPPRYAFIDLQQTVPSSTSGLFTLEIEPVRRADGMVPRVWGFVTAVDDATDGVTVVRAQ